MHFKEGNKERNKRGRETKERKGGEYGIWLAACVFSYAMLNNDLAYKRLAHCRRMRVRR